MRNDSNEKNHKKRTPSKYKGLSSRWIAVGLAVGCAIGLIIENLAMGIPIGICIGIAMDLAFREQP